MEEDTLCDFGTLGLCDRCYKSLQTGDAVSHVGIFDPTL